MGTGVFNLSGNGKALTMGENHGFVKFVFDKATEEILGFHVIGPGPRIWLRKWPPSWSVRAPSLKSAAPYIPIPPSARR